MFIADMVIWWYSQGWWTAVRRGAEKLYGVLDFFSVGSLIRGWFAPFRQISSGSVRGSLDTKFRAWQDRTISRFVGAAVRTVLIFTGLLGFIGFSILYVAMIVAWPILPVLPVVTTVLVLGGKI
jgi:hypothetical protein